MLLLKEANLNNLYVRAIHFIINNGISVSPRGLVTSEIGPTHFILEDPRSRILDVKGRVINIAFAVAEAVWILSGSCDEWIYDFNNEIKQFADFGKLQGAYGPRIRKWQGRIDQLDVVKEKLKTDPYTRQAIVQIFDPAVDYHDYRDVPCTLNYHFLIRDGKLHMITTMRSQDIWLGFPYDIFTATLLQELMAGWLNVDIGLYHHRVDSLHLYERNFDQAQNVALHQDRVNPQFYDIQIEWEHFDNILSAIKLNKSVDIKDWKAISAVIQSYRVWKKGNRLKAIELTKNIIPPFSISLCQWYDYLLQRQLTHSDRVTTLT